MGKDTIILSIILFNVLFISFIGGIVIFIREYRKKKKIHLKELETINLIHKKELLETQVEIQNQTMRHIGKEIHDNIGQKLTLSSLYLQQLIFENKTPQINSEIENVNRIINESLDELRQLSKTLTMDVIENNSIVELIEKECETINQLKELKVSFENSLEVNINSYQVKTILLRVVQEFLQNSLKHSQCKQIHIYMSSSNKQLELILKDDGVGFEMQQLQQKGIGLNNMKKRIEMLEGVFQLQSSSQGTALNVQIPI